MFLDLFNVAMLKIKKYIILMYFQAKIILKNNHYNNTKRTKKSG